MHGLRFALFPLVFASFLLIAPRPARAQSPGPHWDASFDVGGATRFRKGGDDTQGYGGLVGLKAHVALMPLLRVGAYVDHELSSTDEPTMRQYTSVGLRLKFTPPVGSEELRAWIFAGFGYAGVYSKGYTQTVVATDPVTGVQTSATGTAFGAGGGFAEIPVGVGGAWRFRRPWVLNAELAARLGFSFVGSLYSGDGRPGLGPDATGTGLGPAGFGPVGNDTFALILTVGIGFDQ